MVRLPNNSARSLGINMTPMIDVVFQLIIFFLVSSHLSRQETQVQIPLPQADSGVPIAESAHKLMVLNIQQDGTMSSGGEPMSATDLTAGLQRRQQQTSGNLELRLRCHRSVAYSHVKQVLLAASSAGITNVHFAVIHSRDAAAESSP